MPLPPNAPAPEPLAAALVKASAAFILPERSADEFTVLEFSRAHRDAGVPMNEHAARNALDRMIAAGAAEAVGRRHVPGVRSGAMCYRLTGK